MIKSAKKIMKMMKGRDKFEQPTEYSQSESHRAEEQKASACGQPEP